MIFSVVLTVLAAYPLSNHKLVGRRFFNVLFIIPMYFGGGLVPTYIVVKNIGLMNRPIVICILGALSMFNIIIARTYFETNIPAGLQESAEIDGANQAQTFFRIILPLSKPVLAAISLFTGVGLWNTFTPALMYNSDPTKYTFAVKLREMIVVQEDMSRQFEAMMQQMAMSTASGQAMTNEGLSAAMMIISIIPIIIVYPFLQKHFASGLMVGSVKG